MFSSTHYDLASARQYCGCLRNTFSCSSNFTLFPWRSESDEESMWNSKAAEDEGDRVKWNHSIMRVRLEESSETHFISIQIRSLSLTFWPMHASRASIRPRWSESNNSTSTQAAAPASCVVFFVLFGVSLRCKKMIQTLSALTRRPSLPSTTARSSQVKNLHLLARACFRFHFYSSSSIFRCSEQARLIIQC